MIPLRNNNNGDPVEYFLVENFHTQNDYSNANPFLISSLFSTPFSQGLLVFHIENDHNHSTTHSLLDIETAEGLFNWAVLEGDDTPSDRTDDLIGHFTPSYFTGYDERDQLTITIGASTYNDYFSLTSSAHGCGTGDPCPPGCSSTDCNHGWRYHKNAWLGDNDDFFRIGEFENNVFTRWSNPNSHKDDQSISNKGFEVLSYNIGDKKFTLSVQITQSGIESLSPSKPQGLTASSVCNQCEVQLDWVANTETDMDKYKIYRKEVESNGWTFRL